MQRAPIVLTVALLLVAGLGASLLTGQEPRRQEEPSLRDRIQDLSRKLREAHQHLELQREVIQDHEKRLAAVESWLQQVPRAMAVLKEGVDRAERLGFTYAAPNTDSKETLIRTLRDVGARLGSGVPGEPEKR